MPSSLSLHAWFDQVEGPHEDAGVMVPVAEEIRIRAGLSAIGVSPHVHEIVTGTILLAIAVLDA
jgi:hypothetical protein